jgi:hypothetical protein
MNEGLTPKQQKFAQNYLETGNATEAASRAYKPKNRATARVIGSENLTKPNIKAFLEEKAPDAESMICQLSQSAKSENVRLNASRDILDRTGRFFDKKKAGEDYRIRPLPILFGYRDADQEKIQRVLRMLEDSEGEEYVRELRENLTVPKDQLAPPRQR